MTLIDTVDEPISYSADHSNEPVDNKHKQGMWMEFVDKDVERRFVEYRYGGAGLYLPCAVLIVFATIQFSVTQMNFQADVLRDPISTWFFSSSSSWQATNKQTVRNYYYCCSAITAALGIIPLIITFAKRDLVFPGWLLEIVTLCAVGSHFMIHGLFDDRYQEFCRPGEPSVLLRNDFIPTSCHDFVECYVVFSVIGIFVLPIRLKFLTFIFIGLPIPFFLRKPHYGYDYIFRTSDIVWFVNCIIFLVAMLAQERMLRRQFIQREIVQEEAEETQRAQKAVNRLLNAMLPESVLKRLIANETISDMGVVSVVFSDVAGFTAWCSAQKAQAVVSMLNTMYKRFDSGLKRYDIEKVKTIGDAYWAVCGLPDPNPEHVLHLCAFAKFMLRCVTQMGEDDPQHRVHIRIGVTTGNVCGGLVGSQQSTYDMFGNTNEVAELMEQRAPVGGILISEESYRRLKVDHRMMEPNENGEVQCVVELQDEALDTVQGTMATYVLKTFTWIPPRRKERRHRDQERDNSTGGREDSQFGASASSHSYSMSMSTNNVEVIPQAMDTLLHSEPSTKYIEPEQSRRAPPATVEAVSQEEADKNSTPNGNSSHQSGQDVRDGIAAASHCFHHTFDSEETEEEFQQFMDTVFPRKLQVVSTMLNLLALLIYIVMLGEGISHPWYTHLLIITCILATAAQVLLARKVEIRPLVGLAAFYIECNLLLFAIVFASVSVVSMDVFYLPFNFTVMSPSLGYVGGRVPYIYICFANIVFLFLPCMIAQIAIKTMYIHHFIAPVMFVAVWVLSLRRSEIGQRELFVDKKMADVALEETKEEHEKVSELLGRMVPRFIVDELTVWFCGPRDSMIAANLPLVGILFARVPALHHQFADSTIDPLTVMGLIGNYAALCDNVVVKFPRCTKLKIVGDILMFGSGLVAPKQSDATQKQGATDTESSITKTLSAEHASLSSTEDLFSQESGDYSKPSGSTSYLSEMAHLAIALSAEVAEGMNGAVLSAGMHCGRACAGIIGTDRLIYDVFGDTVNTASRVMSTSGEGVWASVKFSTKVAGRTKNHGLFFGKHEERHMKGKGAMHVVSVGKLPDEGADV